MTVLRHLLWCLLAASLVAPAAAHQQKESITKVLFNPRTGNIEVMHRVLLHDVEHAVRQLFGRSADVLSNAEDRDRFEGYIHEQFSLSDQNGDPIALTPVGNEIEDRFLWVYSEAPIPEGLTALTLSHGALRDLWPDQVNLVNVERNKKVQTATFSRGSAQITIQL